MQSKINAFFNPSSSYSSSSSSSPKPAAPPPIVTGGNDDELTVWEKTQHHYCNTYKRRAPNPQSSGRDKSSVQMSEKPFSDDNSRKPESATLGRTVIKNKKRSYAQFYLDFGQSDFNLHTCSTCGVKYTAGDQDDEKAQKAFHKDYANGIPFKGWCNERVVRPPSIEGGRIVLVLDFDPPAQRNKVREVVKRMESELGNGWILHKLCKVYLYILSQGVAGCLVAEPIKEAHKVPLCEVDGSSDSTTTHEAKLSALLFGDIRFQRELMKKSPFCTPSVE